jgi:hypothetical protein
MRRIRIAIRMSEIRARLHYHARRPAISARQVNLEDMP